MLPDALKDALKIVKWKRSLSFCLLFLCMTLLVVQPAMSSGDARDASTVASTDVAKQGSSAELSLAPAAVPFAKVYLAIKGCTSCAACRSALRQLTKGAAKDGKVSLPSEAVEILYDDPTSIPLMKVVGNLAKNRLHNLKLVDVLFDASGRIHADSGGSLLFTIETTGQQYSISVPDGVNAPPKDEPLRLSAVVQGWRASKSDLSLLLKSFTVKSPESDS